MQIEPTMQTPAARVLWVLDLEKQRGRNVGALAEEVGCSRPTLLNWASGHTNMDQVGIGLLLRFCEVTGVNWRWLLYGEDPRMASSPPSPAVSSIAQRLSAMEPEKLELVHRLIEAVAGPETAGSASPTQAAPPAA